MAMPMFRPQTGDDINEMLRRLQMTGGEPQYPPEKSFPIRGVQDGPDLPPVGALPPNELPEKPPGRSWLKQAMGDNFTFTPGSAPPANGAFGAMLGDADAFLRQTADNRPSFAPPAGASTSSIPAFTPAALPEKTPFSPVQVEGAVPHGSFNPGGSNPWDRSMTATTPEQELRLQQQAKYNDVLNMVRPQGTYFPSQVFQPHEIAALSHLGGQQADNLFKGRQLAETSEGQDREQQLRMLLGNQQAQTQLGVADITGRAHVAGAQASHNPEAMRQQAINQMAAAAIAGGADQETVAAHIASLKQALSDSGAAVPPGAGAPGRPTGHPEMNTDEVNATRIFNQAAGMIGQGKPGPEFKYKEGFGVQDADKVLDFMASQRAAGKLSPGAEAAFWRQAQRLPNFNQFRDNLVRSGAGANYQVQPPMDPRTGKPVDLKYTGFAPPYAVSDDHGELYRYQQNPDMTAFRAGVGSLTGEIPYSQVALPNGAGVVDINNSLMSPASWSKKLPPEVLNARKAELDAMIRRLYPATKK